VYYVLAMQCLSTVAVVRRETNSWRWPLVQITYMSALAYGCTFIVYRVGLTLGVGG
jgi:ferrous iron transport protein B